MFVCVCLCWENASCLLKLMKKCKYKPCKPPLLNKSVEYILHALKAYFMLYIMSTHLHWCGLWVSIKTFVLRYSLYHCFSHIGISAQREVWRMCKSVHHLQPSVHSILLSGVNVGTLGYTVHVICLNISVYIKVDWETMLLCGHDISACCSSW